MKGPSDAGDEVLRIDDQGAVRTVTMNRPRELNAADAVMHRRLADVWAETAACDSVRAVILTGTGTAFCAGGDFPRMVATQQDADIQDEVFAEARRTVLGMAGLPQPIIAAVNGPAVGLGASLIALSDISVIADDAFIQDPHLGVGLVPGDGAALLWPLIAGSSRAKEFVLLGERIPAQRAYDVGLVNRVVPGAEVQATAVRLAERLAALPKRAVQDTRRLLNRGVAAAVADSLDFGLAAERQSVTSPDHIERVNELIRRTGNR